MLDSRYLVAISQDGELPEVSYITFTRGHLK